MEAYLWARLDGYAVAVYNEDGLLAAIKEFTNEFAARTYADAINMGVIQHVEA